MQKSGWKIQMKNYEQYKRLMRGAFCLILLAVQAGMFWCVWKKEYSPLMESPYWRKGHWLLLAVYIFLIFIFPKIYGGWKVGYLRVFAVFRNASGKRNHVSYYYAADEAF